MPLGLTVEADRWNHSTFSLCMYNATSNRIDSNGYLISKVLLATLDDQARDTPNNLCFGCKMLVIFGRGLDNFSYGLGFYTRPYRHLQLFAFT